MASRQFVPGRPRRQSQNPSTAEESEATPQDRGGAEDIIEELDELLDEIDAVLEEQAVLVNYRQRSGQ